MFPKGHLDSGFSISFGASHHFSFKIFSVRLEARHFFSRFCHQDKDVNGIPEKKESNDEGENSDDKQNQIGVVDSWNLILIDWVKFDKLLDGACRNWSTEHEMRGDEQPTSNDECYNWSKKAANHQAVEEGARLFLSVGQHFDGLIAWKRNGQLRLFCRLVEFRQPKLNFLNSCKWYTFLFSFFMEW